MRIRAVFACAFLVCAVQSFCQEEAGTPEAVRRILVAVGDDGASASRSDLVRLSKSLALALSEASPSIRVIEYGSDFPRDNEKRMSAAEENLADCWLWVGVGGEKSAPTLGVKSYDLLSQTVLLDETLAFEADLRAMGELTGKWEPLVSLILEKLHLSGSQPAQAAAAQGPRVSLLTIKARAGTVITGLPAGNLTMGIEGTATVSLDAPASYTFRSEVKGFEPVTTRIFLDGDREVEIPQRAEKKWSADITFSNAFFPGAAGRFYLIPGWMFVEADFTAYLFGLQLDSDRMEYSFPLTTFGAQFGGYLNAEDSLFRFYGGAGAFLRVMWDFTSATSPVRLDPLSPFVVQLAFGTELAIAGDFRFFAELTPLWYVSRYPDLLQASLNSDSFLYFWIPLGAISAANLRFGVRWLL